MVIFPDNATIFLTVHAFKNPGCFHSLDNIDAEDVRDIEKFLEGETPNKFCIRVSSVTPFPVNVVKYQEV